MIELLRATVRIVSAFRVFFFVGRAIVTRIWTGTEVKIDEI